MLYKAEIPRLSALREIRLRNANGSPTEEYVYHLTLRATGNREQAEQAKARFALEVMRSQPNA